MATLNTGQAKAQGPCTSFYRLPPSIQFAVEGKGEEALAAGPGYPATVRYDATADHGELASRVQQRIELSCHADRSVSLEVDNFHSGHGIDARGDSIGSLLDSSPENSFQAFFGRCLFARLCSFVCAWMLSSKPCFVDRNL
jgi:hypothetical protein